MLQPIPGCIHTGDTTLHPNSISLGGVYINLSAIARSQGIAVSHLSRIFSGQRTPSIVQAKKIAASLGMGLEDFLMALQEWISSRKPTQPAIIDDNKITENC